MPHKNKKTWPKCVLGYLEWFKTNLFLGENWGGTLILSQISNFSHDFVDFADFSKYLTNSGGRRKKNFLAIYLCNIYVSILYSDHLLGLDLIYDLL